MKKLSGFILLFLFPGLLAAQFKAFGFVEYGYSLCRYKGSELPVFLESYNAYYQPLGLTTPFPTKLSIARGDYFKFGAGFGGDVQAVLDFAIYKNETHPIEARFADGSGRNIWMGLRNSNTTIGIRFGGVGDVPLWMQIDMALCIQHTTIHSEYVFADGSRSMGMDHWLNGSFNDFTLAGGGGLTAGCRIIGPLNISAHANYIFNFGRATPEYHTYDDSQDFKIDIPSYLPRDMEKYISDPFNGIENSISNDVQGWRFTVALQLVFGNLKD